MDHRWPERASSALKRVPLLAHPILLAAYPLLALFQHNQGEIALSVLWRSVLVSAALAVALFVLFTLAFKNRGKGGVLTSLVVVAFFYFGIFRGDVSGLNLSDGTLLAIWLALLAVAVAATVWRGGELVAVNLALSVFALVLVAGPVFRIVSYRRAHPSIAISDPRLWPSRLENLRAPAGPLPDIYFIIPDDYERPNMLKRYFRYDDSGFVRALEKRGFVMAADARSPYSKSEFNMASALNLDYLGRLPSILGKTSEDVLLVRKMIEASRASRLLETLGYRYVHLDSDNITFAGDNPHISALAAPDNLTYLWLRNSLLRFVGGRYGFNEAGTNERFRRSIRSAFSGLEAVPRKPGPKFVVFHTLMPHDPYVFDANGQSTTFPDRSDTGHSTKLGIRYYVSQLRFLNGKLLAAIDAIQAQSKVPPIIILESDEGFEALEEDWGEATVRDMRVKGLSAFSLPGKVRASIPQKLNTVNSLRVVFNLYFGTRLPLLSSASYPELDAPYQFEPMRVR